MSVDPDSDVHPSAQNSFLFHAEIDRGSELISELFIRKFGAPPPTFGRHLVSMLRQPDGSLLPVGYVHLWSRDAALGFVGGVVTDERALRRMTAEQRAALKRGGGGVYFHLLLYTFARFEKELQAFVGYCGDARALAVNLAAGFLLTPHPHLLIRPNGELGAERLAALVREAHAQGPF